MVYLPEAQTPLKNKARSMSYAPVFSPHGEEDVVSLLYSPKLGPLLSEVLQAELLDSEVPWQGSELFRDSEPVALPSLPTHDDWVAHSRSQQPSHAEPAAAAGGPSSSSDSLAPFGSPAIGPASLASPQPSWQAAEGRQSPDSVAAEPSHKELWTVAGSGGGPQEPPAFCSRPELLDGTEALHPAELPEQQKQQQLPAGGFSFAPLGGAREGEMGAASRAQLAESPGELKAWRLNKAAAGGREAGTAGRIGDTPAEPLQQEGSSASEGGGESVSEREPSPQPSPLPLEAMDFTPPVSGHVMKDEEDALEPEPTLTPSGSTNSLQRLHLVPGTPPPEEADKARSPLPAAAKAAARTQQHHAGQAKAEERKVARPASGAELPAAKRARVAEAEAPDGVAAAVAGSAAAAARPGSKLGSQATACKPKQESTPAAAAAAPGGAKLVKQALQPEPASAGTDGEATSNRTGRKRKSADACLALLHELGGKGGEAAAGSRHVSSAMHSVSSRGGSQRSTPEPSTGRAPGGGAASGLPTRTVSFVSLNRTQRVTRHARQQQGESWEYEPFEPRAAQLTMEMAAGSNRWYRAYLVEVTETELHVRFPDPDGGEDIFQWVNRSSGRIWRGSEKMRDWKSLGHGAWAPRTLQQQPPKQAPPGSQQQQAPKQALPSSSSRAVAAAAGPAGEQLERRVEAAGGPAAAPQVAAVGGAGRRGRDRDKDGEAAGTQATTTPAVLRGTDPKVGPPSSRRLATSAAAPEPVARTTAPAAVPASGRRSSQRKVSAGQAKAAAAGKSAAAPKRGPKAKRL